ncbi:MULTISPECIES: hypothetical protein [unclassified Roseibium]|uniref:hypothetical protein n=1 Tax=unclassified Roseibium TaxID=2629323 RepID=UPI00273F4D70|nr:MULTISPECIES: hypothetical protein [unclassified Roseibium]
MPKSLPQAEAGVPAEASLASDVIAPSPAVAAAGVASNEQEDQTDSEQPHLAWRQGDYTVDTRDFVCLIVEDDQIQAVAKDVEGLVVVTQTCDIVNDGPGREDVVVCPLVKVDSDLLKAVEKGTTPTFAILEHSPTSDIIVDLSRMMSVKKSVLGRWSRVEGITSVDRREKFANDLERKYGRFAFPDEFVAALRKWRGRIIQKHEKDSDHGKIYRSIEQIRVVASPHWDAEEVEITLVFFVSKKPLIELSKIHAEIEEQIGKIQFSKPFLSADPPYMLGTLEQIPAFYIYYGQLIDVMFLSGIDD